MIKKLGIIISWYNYVNLAKSTMFMCCRIQIRKRGLILVEKKDLNEKISKLVEVGKSKNSVLEEKDVVNFFKNDALSAEEMELVYKQLEDSNVDGISVYSWNNWCCFD